MFKGFRRVQSPVYTTILPQTGLTFDVRGLNVREVSKLKSSLTTAARATKIINDILWEAVEGGPEFIKTKEDFKRTITTSDREALLYGLFQETFGDTRDYDVKCRSCAFEESIKIHISKAFGMNAYPYALSVKKSYKMAKAADPDGVYDPEVEDAVTRDSIKVPKGMPPEMARREFDISDEDNDELDAAIKDKLEYVEDGDKEDQPIDLKDEIDEENCKTESYDKYEEDIISKRVRVDLPVTGVVAIIRQPTIHHEEKLNDEIPLSNKDQVELVGETLIIDRFEEYEPGIYTPVNVITNREDILYGYQQLHMKDKNAMFDSFKDNFGQYGIEIKSAYHCNRCAAKNDLSINIMDQFFRLIVQS